MNILSDNEYGRDYGHESCCRSSRRSRDYNDHNDCCCNNHGQEPGKAILSCGSGGAGPLPIIETPLNRPIPVASVSIDTRCLENPKVLINFNAIINIPAGVTTNLSFIIRKSTKCSAPQSIGGTYTFSEATGNGEQSTLSSESFSFSYCDCSPCPDCTTYTVEIEPSSLITDTAGLTITNATLSALAVETLC